MHRSPTGNLVPLDLEIEATLKRNRAERRRKLLQDRTVASILEEETHFSDSLMCHYFHLFLNPFCTILITD